MSDEARPEVAALRRQLHAARLDPAMQLMLKYLDRRLEAIKTTLLEAPPEKVARLQGEASAYKHLHMVLTVPLINPPTAS